MTALDPSLMFGLPPQITAATGMDAHTHAVGHTFDAFNGTAHGLANAIALPHVLKFSEERVRARLSRRAEVIDAGGESDDDKARRFIAGIRGLMATVDILMMLAAITESDVSAIAKQALAEAHLSYPVPR